MNVYLIAGKVAERVEAENEHDAVDRFYHTYPDAEDVEVHDHWPLDPPEDK